MCTQNARHPHERTYSSAFVVVVAFLSATYACYYFISYFIIFNLLRAQSFSSNLETSELTRKPNATQAKLRYVFLPLRQRRRQRQRTVVKTLLCEGKICCQKNVYVLNLTYY